jgi:ribulose-bisphosphate carboxylase large chain
MSQDRVVARYLLETPHTLEHAAQVLAGEQSSGTFVAVPGETHALKERFGAKVESIKPLESVNTPSLPGSKAPRSQGGRVEYHRGEAVISFPLHNFGPSIPNLLATVAGNLYELQELSGVRLIDLELPRAFAECYPGPGFGIEGTRKLANVHGRPLIGTIIKPSIGLSIEAHRLLVRDLARAGLDFIKDDELNADPPYAPLAERVPAAMREIQRIAEETGKKTMYAFNISGDIEHMLRGHDLVKEHGAWFVVGLLIGQFIAKPG